MGRIVSRIKAVAGAGISTPARLQGLVCLREARFPDDIVNAMMSAPVAPKG